MRVLLIVGMLLLRISSLAQSYLVKHYTVHDGLVNDEVFCFAQDTSGVMWIGTDNGLSSFDGRSFRNYFPEDGLPGKSIMSLVLNEKGQLWAGGYSKGISLREQNGFETTWRVVKNYRAGFDILEHSGSFWETKGNSLSILDSNGINARYAIEEFIPLKEMGFFKDKSNVNLELSPDQQAIWVGSAMGLTALGNDMKPYSILNNDIRPRGVSEIAHLDDGSSLLGGSGIVRRVRDNKVERIYELGLQDTFRVHRILVLDAEAWVAVEGVGLLSFNLVTGKVTNQKALLGIEAEVIHHLFLDRDKNIWVATRADGVYCLQSTLIQKYHVDSLLCNKDFTSLSTLANGDLAILTSGGLIFRHPNGVFERCFCQPNSNNFGMLTKQDPPMILSTLQERKPPGLGILTSSSAYELRRNEIIYQLSAGNPDRKQRLIRAKFDGKSWLTQSVISLDLFFQGSQIRHIFLDSAGYFWLGNHQDSLWMVTTPHEELIKADISTDTKGYQLPQLQKLLVDSEGTIWVCGRKSIWKKEESDSVFSTYLENDDFYDMDMQEDGTIWIASGRGLLSVRNAKTQLYGLNGYRNLGQINAMHIPNGGDRLWMASREGLFSISLSALEARLFPDLHLFLSGINVNQQNINSVDSIRLQLDENFQIKVGAASFFFDLPLRFRYRTNGGAWTETESSSITLPASQIGQVIGEISASLPGGNWGPSLRIDYEVRPDFWSDPITWLGFAILIILAAFGIARFQITKVRKREAHERAIQQEFHRLEQQAFSAMLNPHFIFNTINSIQQELLEEDPMLAHRHLSKFAKLIRKNMDLSTRSTISLKEELERLSLYLEMEKLRLGEKIETVIQTDPQIPLTEVEIPSMILQPYVENAIWHGILLTGESGTVTVRVSLIQNNQILIEIEDNGIGIEVAKSRIRSENHISMGMAITQARINSFHDETSVVIEQINDEAGVSRGTLVKIVIPLKIQLGLDS